MTLGEAALCPQGHPGRADRGRPSASTRSAPPTPTRGWGSKAFWTGQSVSDPDAFPEGLNGPSFRGRGWARRRGTEQPEVSVCLRFCPPPSRVPHLPHPSFCPASRSSLPRSQSDPLSFLCLRGAQGPFSPRAKAKDLPVPCEALQDVASVTCPPHPPGCASLLRPVAPSPFPPGTSHPRIFARPLPGMLFPWTCPWLTPPPPPALCLPVIPSSAAASKIPRPPLPRYFLSAFPASFFLCVIDRALII